MELVRKCAGAVCLLGIMTGLLFLGRQEGKLTADKEMQQAVTPEAKEAAGEGKSAEEEVRKIAITFDDGPHPKYTAELLDGLKERGVVVTFFMTGENAEANRELVKRDNNNVFDFLESEGYIRLKADACTSSKELYEVYKMWCEENSMNAIKARGFSDELIANQRRYNLESTNNIVNSSGRRVRGFVGIEALVQPDLTPNGWRA